MLHDFGEGVTDSNTFYTILIVVGLLDDSKKKIIILKTL